MSIVRQCNSSGCMRSTLPDKSFCSDHIHIQFETPTSSRSGSATGSIAPGKRIEKVTIGNATLYCGDCLEILPTLHGVDTVVTDPPFNAGKDFENDNLAGKDFRAFCNRVALALYSLKPKNVLIETGKQDSKMREEVGRYFDYKYAICLNYTNSMRNGVIGYANWGLVYWFAMGGKCVQRYKDRLDSELNSTKGQFTHPSPKEIKHYRQLCKMFCERGGTICDPFMGSGTTGIAALAENMMFVGIEKEKEYFDLSCQRIEKENAQLKLFAPKKQRKVSEQAKLF